jgi:hypothetical protein
MAGPLQRLGEPAAGLKIVPSLKSCARHSSTTQPSVIAVNV